MDEKILLITPSDGFGELIREALVNDGGYQVDRALDGLIALDLAQDTRYDLAILDCDTPGIAPAELTHTLLDWHPRLRLIAVPPGNDPAHPLISQINPHAFLTKPFYLPDMLKIVSRVLEGAHVDVDKLAATTAHYAAASDAPPAAPPRAPEIPLSLPVPPARLPAAEDLRLPWLRDVNRAAQYLARLSLETAARAALIVHGDTLWAYAGDFPQPEATRIADTVARHWGRHSGTDLAQFIRLENEQEFMLYATGLVDNLVLALIFEARTPFSKIRAQATQLAHALSSAPEEDPAPADTPPQWFAPASGGAPEPGGTRPPAGESAPRPASPFPASIQIDEAQPAPPDWFPAPLTGEADRLAQQPPPAPRLPAVDIPARWMPSGSIPEGPRSFLEDLLRDPSITGPVALNTPKPAAADGLLPAAPLPYQQPAFEPPLPPTVDETRPTPGQPIFPEPENMEETRPTRLTDLEPLPRLEPDASSFYNLSYACVLVPRMPQHHLIRDIARKLEDWLPQICLAFNWRLEHISVRPDYLQWMVSVPPATAPAFLMQIITRTTSQRIFHHLPRLGDENPSGEFWAPTYLILASRRLPDPATVNDFLQNTRRRQGLG
jgi:REP element-mobilizing transposase RayT/CheY-like chemotaxis protein